MFLGSSEISVLFSLTGLAVFLPIFWGSSSVKKPLVASIFLMSVGLFFTQDILVFYGLAELIGLTSFVALLLENRNLCTPKNLAWHFLGGLFVLPSVAYLMLSANEQQGSVSLQYSQIQNLEFTFSAAQVFSEQTLLFFSLTVPFFVRANISPFFSWVSNTFENGGVFYRFLISVFFPLIGIFGMANFSIGLFAEAANYWAWLAILLGLTTAVLSGLYTLVAARESVIFYVVCSNTGLFVAGLFSHTSEGYLGSLLGVLGQSLAVTLCFCDGFLFRKKGIRFSTVGILSLLSAPLTVGFVSTVLLFKGFWMVSPVLTVFSGLSLILNGQGMRRMISQGSYFPDSEPQRHSTSLQSLLLTPILVLVLGLGVYPGFLFDFTENKIRFRLFGDRVGPDVGGQ